MSLTVANPEQERYRKAWNMPEYRHSSPAELFAPLFLFKTKAKPGDQVIDFGCGTGRGALALALNGGLKVKMLDFADNCLDPQVQLAVASGIMEFSVADLTHPIQDVAPYGFCCDVMEHIPTEDVPKVLQNILGSARRVFFNIAGFNDIHGDQVDGSPLHLTVKPMQWWLDQLEKLGATIYWSQEIEELPSYLIYCGAWKDAKDVLTIGKVNGEEDIERQVLGNIRAGWKQAEPHVRQDREIILLAGGPSMPDHLDQIRELRREGAAIVTVNGAYHWAIEHGLDPAAQIVLDARQFNSRFTKPVIDGCKYLIASQAHPDTLDGLPRENTFLWHSAISEEAQAEVKRIHGAFLHIPGGSTVTLRAILLLRMLGFWRLHLFGFDSCCLPDGTHHAYEQKENDGMPTLPVLCGGRSFNCAPWMLAQAYEFRDMVAMLGDEVEMAVYGDGLIAHMIATGARISTEKEH